MTASAAAGADGTAGARAGPDPTLYLFDGSNLLHAGGLESREELVDRLAGFVALAGARGVVVFDGAGSDRTVGPLEVRHHPHADELIERLAAEHREGERVAVVSSDRAIGAATGQLVRHHDSAAFLRDLAAAAPGSSRSPRNDLEGRLDDDVRRRLEDLRRGKR